MTNFIKHRWFPILVIGLINMGLRMINLGDAGLWYDESFTVFHAQQGIGHVWEMGQVDTNPPLYNIFISLFISVFGDSEFSVRFFSVLITSCLASFLFFSIRKHFNWQAAAYVSLLFICSDFMLHYSQETRCYSLLALLSVISTHLHFNFLGQQNWKNSLLIGVFFTLGMYTHYAFSMLAIVLSLYTIITFIRNTKVLLRYGSGLLLSVGLFAFWIPYLIQGFENTSDGTFWLQYQGLKDILKPLKAIFLGDFWHIGLISFGVLFGLFLIGKSNLYDWKRKGYLLVIITFMPTLIASVVSFSTPIYLPRYLIFSVLSFLILIGVLIAYAKPRAVGLIVLLIIVITQFTIWTPGRKKQLVREAVGKLKEIRKTNDLVFVQTPSVVITFAYYFDKEWFRNYSDFSTYSSSRNIVVIETGQNFNPEHCNNFDRILLFQAYARIGDPKGSLVTELKKNYEYEGESTFDNVQLKVFNNLKKDSNETYDLIIQDTIVTYGGKRIDPKLIDLRIEKLQDKRDYYINNDDPTTTQIYDISFRNIRVFANTYFRSGVDINPTDDGNMVHFIAYAKDSLGKDVGWFSRPSNVSRNSEKQWQRSEISCHIKYPNLNRLSEVRFYAQPEYRHNVLLRDYKVTIHNVQLKIPGL